MAVDLVRPDSFVELNLGDSIAVDGVCLTLSGLNARAMSFDIGVETQLVTQWGRRHKVGQMVNLERSLLLQSRVHGHLVTGHVDTLGNIVASEQKGECRFLTVAIQPDMAWAIWRKGSVALNGVSLTVNQVHDFSDHVAFEVCLIPETIRRTNLDSLRAGGGVHVEFDQLARALQRRYQLHLEDR